jgi:hypothetical protein
MSRRPNMKSDEMAGFRSERACPPVKLKSITSALSDVSRANTQESGMTLPPARPDDHGDPLDTPRLSGTVRQQVDSSSIDRPDHTGFAALLGLRERLKRSSHRPQWWSDHLRGIGR